jgi:hypothetical protein
MADLTGDAASGDGTGEFGIAQHRHRQTIVWVETVINGCVVADTRDFRQFELSGASAQLWKHFDGQRSDAVVIATVLSLYPDHPETAADDCAALIEELEQLGLLESTRPQPGDVKPSNGRRGL